MGRFDMERHHFLSMEARAIAIEARLVGTASLCQVAASQILLREPALARSTIQLIRGSVMELRAIADRGNVNIKWFRSELDQIETKIVKLEAKLESKH